MIGVQVQFRDEMNVVAMKPGVDGSTDERKIGVDLLLSKLSAYQIATVRA